MLGKLKGKDHLEDKGVEGRISFKRILKKWDGKAGNEIVWAGTIGGLVSTMQWGSDCVKYREFFGQLSNC
jgi:hypothetical protein